MPTETTGEGVAYRSHKLVSPLESEALLASCAQCHGDTDMTAYVKEIQDKVPQSIALDGGDNLTFLATSGVNLNLNKERYPKVVFSATREH